MSYTTTDTAERLVAAIDAEYGPMNSPDYPNLKATSIERMAFMYAELYQFAQVEHTASQTLGNSLLQVSAGPVFDPQFTLDGNQVEPEDAGIFKVEGLLTAERPSNGAQILAAIRVGGTDVSGGISRAKISGGSFASVHVSAIVEVPDPGSIALRVEELTSHGDVTTIADECGFSVERLR